MDNIEENFISLRNRKQEEEPLVSSATINSYLDKRLKSSERKIVESALAQCPRSKALFDLKKAEREFIADLIPSPVYVSRNKEKITAELADVTKAILVDTDSLSVKKMSKKIYKFLTTPVL